MFPLKNTYIITHKQKQNKNKKISPKKYIFSLKYKKKYFTFITKQKIFA